MSRSITTLLRYTLSLAILLISPGVSAYAAAAESVSVKTIGGPLVIVPVAATLNRSVEIMPPQLPSVQNIGVLQTGEPVATPMSEVPSAVAQIPGIGEAAVATPQADTIPGMTGTPQGEEPGSRGTLGSLMEAGQPEISPTNASSTDSGWRIGRLFDKLILRRGLSDAPNGTGSVDVRGFSAKTASVLGKSSPRATAKVGAASPVLPHRTVSRGLQRAAAVLLVAGLVLALPGIAMAAAPGAATVASVSLLSSVHPLATAFAAVAGSVYGLIAAHKKEGGAPSSGEALASVLRYGILAGAGTYVLLGLTQGLFMGFTAETVAPLPTALATAALGQSAFQGKFTDPTSTPADRIMGAFPAIAAAVGISVGVVALSALTLSLPFTLAAGAMSVTGVASAFYAALYKPGKSSADGAAAMGRGYVLQSLMTGLALTVTNPYLIAPFALLALWGFWNVISATSREMWGALPDWVRAYFKEKK